MTKGMNTVHTYSTHSWIQYNMDGIKEVLAWHTEDKVDTVTVYHATAKVGCPKFRFNPTGNCGRNVGAAMVVGSLAWDHYATVLWT